MKSTCLKSLPVTHTNKVTDASAKYFGSVESGVIHNVGAGMYPDYMRDLQYFR